MANIGAYSRHKFMDELDDPLDTQEGVLSPATQRLRVLRNVSGTEDIVLADMQKLADISVTAAQINAAASGTTADGVGTAATGVTATEYGNAFKHTTVLTFTNLVIGAVGDISNIARGVLLYTFPAGIINVTGSLMSVGITLSDSAAPTTDTPDLGLGTVIASGAVATLDGTPTFEDIMTGQTVNDVAGTVEFTSVNTVKAILAAGAHTVHLNIADGWADITPNNPNALGTGTVSITWERVTSS